jgi:hypothetical protein
MTHDITLYLEAELRRIDSDRCREQLVPFYKDRIGATQLGVMLQTIRPKDPESAFGEFNNMAPVQGLGGVVMRQLSHDLPRVKRWKVDNPLINTKNRPFSSEEIKYVLYEKLYDVATLKGIHPITPTGPSTLYSFFGTCWNSIRRRNVPFVAKPDWLPPEITDHKLFKDVNDFVDRTDKSNGLADYTDNFNGAFTWFQQSMQGEQGLVDVLEQYNIAYTVQLDDLTKQINKLRAEKDSVLPPPTKTRLQEIEKELGKLYEATDDLRKDVLYGDILGSMKEALDARQAARKALVAGPDFASNFDKLFMKQATFFRGFSRNTDDMGLSERCRAHNMVMGAIQAHNAAVLAAQQYVSNKQVADSEYYSAINTLKASFSQFLKQIVCESPCDAAMALPTATNPATNPLPPATNPATSPLPPATNPATSPPTTTPLSRLALYFELDDDNMVMREFDVDEVTPVIRNGKHVAITNDGKYVLPVINMTPLSDEFKRIDKSALNFDNQPDHIKKESVRALSEYVNCMLIGNQISRNMPSGDTTIEDFQKIHVNIVINGTASIGYAIHNRAVDALQDNIQDELNNISLLVYDPEYASNISALYLNKRQNRLHPLIDIKVEFSNPAVKRKRNADDYFIELYKIMEEIRKEHDAKVTSATSVPVDDARVEREKAATEKHQKEDAAKKAEEYEKHPKAAASRGMVNATANYRDDKLSLEDVLDAVTAMTNNQYVVYVMNNKYQFSQFYNFGTLETIVDDDGRKAPVNIGKMYPRLMISKTGGDMPVAIYYMKSGDKPVMFFVEKPPSLSSVSTRQIYTAIPAGYKHLYLFMTIYQFLEGNKGPITKVDLKEDISFFESYNRNSYQ